MSRPRIPEPVNHSSTASVSPLGDDQLLRLTEVAPLLAVKSTQQVRDLIRRGVLASVDIGAPRPDSGRKKRQRISRRVRVGDLRAFIRERTLSTTGAEHSR